jgi:hypothetical protein
MPSRKRGRRSIRSFPTNLASNSAELLSYPPTEALLAAVEAIYETAAAPSTWPKALQRIADVFDDVGSVLIYHREDGSFGTVVSPSLEAAQRAYEQGGWHRRDTRAIRAIERGLTMGDAFTDRHLLTAEEIARDPFYTDFLIPQSLASTFLTDVAYHCPPRAVWTPRAFNASAISLSVCV